MKFILLIFNSFTLLVFHHTIYAQTSKVLGCIIDSISKQPIEFAHIHILGNDTILQSNNKGMFTINNQNFGSYLLITCIGYEEKRVYVSSMSNKIIISLQQSLNNLPEVVVKSIKADSLVKLAYKNLSKNTNHSTIYTIFNLHESIEKGDSCIFKGEATIKTYNVSAFDNINNNQVKILNHKIQILDSATIMNLNLINDTYAVLYYDIIKAKPKFIKGNDNKIKYIYEDKIIYNNINVHKINFYSKYYHGYLYIEENTFNFIKIDFNVVSHLSEKIITSTYKKIYQKISIQYKKINNKISLDSGNIFITAVNKFTLKPIDLYISFSLSEIITDNVFPFSDIEIAPHKPLFKL